MPALATPSQQPPPAARRTSSGQLHQLSFPALGTTCTVQYATSGSSRPMVAFEFAAVSWVQAFEGKYTRFQPTSLVSQINAAAGRSWVEVDEGTEEMFKLCDSLHAMTQGVLDPTALPLIKLWNWKAENPLIPTDPEIAAARRLTGWTKVQRAPGRVFLPEPGMALDFGGFGKEYAVDIIAQTAALYGITDVLVDFGHDLSARGTPPGRPAWHIGLENPATPGHHTGSIAVTNKGVASSGDYVRCFRLNGRRYGHIIDPRTGWPVANGCLQATVIAGSCLQAGVLSTTAFVLGLKAGIDFIRSFPGAEGILVGDAVRAQTPHFFNYVVT